MQPYFFPYLGYFQLINAVDTFVVYDNIQYAKRGWVNRNRYLRDGEDSIFTLPLKRDSDFLNINQRSLAESFELEKAKIKRKIESAYRKAPYFEAAYSLFTDCLDFGNDNLFDFLLNSLRRINDHLRIATELVISSTLGEDPSLHGKQRVMAICKILRAKSYINPIGGRDLYDREEFYEEGVLLSFIETKDVTYRQFDNEFVPNLSILDVLMFNDIEQARDMLSEYELR